MSKPVTIRSCKGRSFNTVDYLCKIVDGRQQIDADSNGMENRMGNSMRYFNTSQGGDVRQIRKYLNRFFYKTSPLKIHEVKYVLDRLVSFGVLTTAPTLSAEGLVIYSATAKGKKVWKDANKVFV